MAAISYVTGSHNVKVGLQDAWGPYKRWNTANGDLYQIYNGGSPLQVTVLNTPLQTAEYLDANLGVYVQDSWRLNRFTFNLGLRYDYARQRVMGEPAQTGRFAQSVAYDDIYLPTWTSWSPRTSVVYDLSGVGKTALKFGFNRYETAVDHRLRADLQPDGAHHGGHLRGTISTATTSPRANAAACS